MVEFRESRTAPGSLTFLVFYVTIVALFLMVEFIMTGAATSGVSCPYVSCKIL